MIPAELNGIKFNLLDTPGYFDFIGEMYGAKRASEGSVLVVDASSGIEVGTEKAWKNLEKYVTPRIIFLNKMDKEDIEFDQLVMKLKEKFDEKIIPCALPIGEADGFKGFISVLDKKAYEYSGKERKEVELTEEQQSQVESIRETLLEKIAETDEGSNKVVKDRSWFERGTLLLISGIRQGDTFKCKKYSNSVYGNHTIMKINKVNKDGTLRIQSERYQI